MPKTVLIVDDVPFVRRTLKEILTAAHYQVIGEAADGEEAVRMYMQLRPDVVTMDVVMPKMSGIDAARSIIKADSAARIVMISAMGQESLVMEAINVGASDYMMKPFTSHDVLATIDRLFSDSGAPTKAGSTKPAEARR